MKKSVALVTTTAVSLGLATILTVSAVAPSFAATHKTTGSAFSSSSTASGTNNGSTKVAPATVSVNFTVTNVPSAYTTAAAAAKNLLFKVVPLASDATSAPATAPVPSFGAKGAPDNDGDGPGHGGAWTPSGTSTTAPTTGTTPAPTTSRTAAPTFGGDNDGDGPAAGKGKGRGHGHGPAGFGPGASYTNLVLSNGTLTGTITVPAGRTAGVQKLGVYPFFAADAANNVAAKTGTPVMLTITTVADATTGALTASVTGSSSSLAFSIG